MVPGTKAAGFKRAERSLQGDQMRCLKLEVSYGFSCEHQDHQGGKPDPHPRRHGVCEQKQGKKKEIDGHAPGDDPEQTEKDVSQNFSDTSPETKH